MVETTSTLKARREARRLDLISRFKLPFYTVLEEVLNSISHAAGAVFGVVALVLMLTAAIPTGSTVAIASSAIFGVSLIALYLNSAVYHGWFPSRLKKCFQVLDHCTIFILITGTYAPCSLMIIGGTQGVTIFAVVAAVSALGIALNIIDMEKYKVVSMICYLATGWCIMLAFSSISDVMSYTQLALLIWGGIAYTIGAIIYAIGSKVRYMHSLWHLFVLAGSVLQFLSIYDYILAL